MRRGDAEVVPLEFPDARVAHDLIYVVGVAQVVAEDGEVLVGALVAAFRAHSNGGPRQALDVQIYESCSKFALFVSI